MSLRAFTVFQDTPSTDLAKPVASTGSITSPTLTSRPVIVNGATPLSTAEKENVHPLTGERTGPSAINSKKRKTTVLATKLQTPLMTKKQKESKESLVDSSSDVKKRKSTGTSKVKKDGKATSSRKVSKKPSRRVSPLPKVDEEAEAGRERDRITQANVDSRCYELTVKPLADVSQAFDEEISIKPATINEEDMSKFRSVKESSAEPEIRDYFSSPQSAILPPASDGAPSTTDRRTFSTPERKAIYAAFTFTSPSPTSERFSKATRTNTVLPLELV